VVTVSLDDPSDARVYFAADLEPAVDGAYALEFHSRDDTVVSYDAGSAVLAAYNSSGVRLDMYLYSSAPLLSWSGSNQEFATYLASDVLDEQVAAGGTDGRVAVVVAAQAAQHFYIGSGLLTGAERADPTGALATLRAGRAAALAQLPTIESAALPRLELVNFLSNLFHAYLINPEGRSYYSDRAVIYGADSFMLLLLTPELLPDSWLTAFANLLDLLGDQRYTNPTQWRYAYKLDLHTRPFLPSWYTGGIPGYLGFRPDGSVEKGQWSDLYETAQYIMGVRRYWEVTGDGAFVDTQQGAVLDALDLLKRFDSQYDSEYGEDGDRYPNLLMPMSNLGGIAGTYPSETATTIYAYRAAEALLRRWGLAAAADDLVLNYIGPMTAGFDSHFWDGGLGFYTGVADGRSLTRAAGTRYQDKWCQGLFSALMGDLGDARLGALVATYLASGFYEAAHDVHWLSPDSENWCYPGRWGTSTGWTNGFTMHGGFYDGLPGVAVPVAYYQMGEGALGTQYAGYYLDVWLRQGPYESMYEWNHEMPGRFIETSIYIEPTASTTWLLREALRLEVVGTEVTIAPILPGEFRVTNLHVTAQGLTAVLDYWRDADGREHLVVHSNEGLTIHAPQASPTVVELGSFIATSRDGYVLLEWETLSEVDTVGFNLYRADSANGPFVRINDSLIPSRTPGNPVGGAYTYRDANFIFDKTHYYKLEDVDTHGTRTFHGPVAATPARIRWLHVRLR